MNFTALDEVMTHTLDGVILRKLPVLVECKDDSIRRDIKSYLGINSSLKQVMVDRFGEFKAEDNLFFIVGNSLPEKATNGLEKYIHLSCNKSDVMTQLTVSVIVNPSCQPVNFTRTRTVVSVQKEHANYTKVTVDGSTDFKVLYCDSPESAKRLLSVAEARMTEYTTLRLHNQRENLVCETYVIRVKNFDGNLKELLRLKNLIYRYGKHLSLYYLEIL